VNHGIPNDQREWKSEVCGLARRLEVKQATVAKWERPGAVYRKKTREKLAKVFGVNESTFL
jgi:ribosome-binding protein aMBF1 (putative translation factor)